MTRTCRQMGEERAAAVFDEFTRCAEHGRMAPSNTALAEILGITRLKTVTDTIRRLERQGAIKVERYSMSRVVTICATGKRTAGKVGRPHWADSDASVAPNVKAQRKALAAASVAEPEPVRVRREPCPLCAVRKDIGCRHSRAVRRIMFVPVSLHAAEVAKS